MRAIIDATGYKSSLDPLLNFRPSPLLTVCGKPILSHVLDILSHKKISHYDLLLGHLPAKIEEFIGDGSRWGISVTYHLVRDMSLIYGRMKALGSQCGDDLIFIAKGDCIPNMDWQSLKEQPSKPQLWMYPHHHWSGWGILSTQMISKIKNSSTVKTLPEQLPTNIHLIHTLPLVNSDSLHEYQKSNLNQLHHESSILHFPPHTQRISQGIWISRGCNIHPTAKLVPPIFIGEYCQISKDCQIGPKAVVESHCLIDSASKVSHSLILSRSYVGEGLNVENSIIDRNQLINLSLNAAVRIRDDFILCELSHPSLSEGITNIFERLIAIFLCFILSPIFLLMLCNHQFHSQPMVRLPTKSDDHWQDFNLLSFKPKIGKHTQTWQKPFLFLPTLYNVVLGHLHFVGVSPKVQEEIKQMPSEWQNLYLDSKAGIISLAQLDDASLLSDDEIYATEAYYAVNKGFFSDITILWRWLKMKL